MHRTRVFYGVAVIAAIIFLVSCGGGGGGVEANSEPFTVTVSGY